jgi:hypothetical protein
MTPLGFPKKEFCLDIGFLLLAAVFQAQVCVERHAAQRDNGAAHADDSGDGTEDQVTGDHDDNGLELAQHHM